MTRLTPDDNPLDDPGDLDAWIYSEPPTPTEAQLDAIRGKPIPGWIEALVAVLALVLAVIVLTLCW